jgi:hypothetical protein
VVSILLIFVKSPDFTGSFEFLIRTGGDALRKGCLEPGNVTGTKQTPRRSPSFWASRQLSVIQLGDPGSCNVAVVADENSGFLKCSSSANWRVP